MASEALPAIAESKPGSFSIPNFFAGTLVTKGGTYTISPILPTDREAAIKFMTTYQAPFLRDGKPLEMEVAAARVDVLIQRHLNGDPWSIYLIRSSENSIEGIWGLGYDDAPHTVVLSAAINSTHQGIGTEAWKWIHDLFLEMHKRGVVVRGAPLKEATLCLTSHPNHPTLKEGLLERAGFVSTLGYVDKSYVGNHDGRRIRYEMPIAKLLACAAALLGAPTSIHSAAPLFFTPEMIGSHLKEYSDEEKQRIEEDLKVVRSVCFGDDLKAVNSPTYLATAGAPGSRKTTILEKFMEANPDWADGVYLDPDPRTLKYMVHTYARDLSPLNIARFGNYGLLLRTAYEKWRGASNYIVLTLLEEAFARHLPIAHGATSTGGHIPAFFTRLHEAGYKVVLLLCSCRDDFREKSIEYRNREIKFYQNSPEDAIAKGKVFPERMGAFFERADEMRLYWSDNLETPERLAAVFENGELVVKDQDAFDRFIDKYEADRAELAKEGKKLPPFEALAMVYAALYRH